MSSRMSSISILERLSFTAWPHFTSISSFTIEILQSLSAVTNNNQTLVSDPVGKLFQGRKDNICWPRLDMKVSLLSLDPGISPGFGGLRNEHLRCLAETWEQQDMAVLDCFGLWYLNGDLPPFFYKVWGSVSTTPIFKNLETNEKRSGRIVFFKIF